MDEKDDDVVKKDLCPQYGKMIFYKTKLGGIRVICGWFSGSIWEFRKKVLETQGNSGFAKEYLRATEFVELFLKSFFEDNYF